MERNSKSSVLSYIPFSLFVSTTYWYKLADKKLLKDKREEVVDHMWGYCSIHQNLPRLLLDYSSFNKECSLHLGQPVKGYQLNKNSKELFNDENNLNAIIQKVGNELLENVKNGNFALDLRSLVPFILYTFSDLKAFKFYYRICYVTYEDEYFYWCDGLENVEDILTCEQKCVLRDVHNNLPPTQQLMYFIYINSNSTIIAIKISDFILNYRNYPSCDTYLCIFDPVRFEDKTSLIVRNGLFFLFLSIPDIFNETLKVILLKSIDDVSNSKSCLLRNIKRMYGPLPEVPVFSGLETNESGDVIRFTDLSSTMDPVKLSEKLSYLNLKLMTWNVEPDFDLEKVTANSCLLLGAGTLGCSVARSLIGWGFKKLSFVDCGTVSFGNPIRQSLYTFNDCVNKKNKVEAAVAAVKNINPHIEAEGIHFVIPALGRGPIDMDDYDKLEQLITSHDIIFLLTDSRESRWLPTLISSFCRKITITAALGFDSYLVMRHGISNDDKEKLGCYFCTDVIAPGDSLYGRPLDQQCTVTRPGVADIASALAVEMIVSLLHHPEQGRAESDGECCFGRIPHTVRGYLRDFSQIFPSFKSYDKCVACSSLVLSEFEKNKSQFLNDVFNSPNILEDVTGITEMKACVTDESMQALSDSE